MAEMRWNKERSIHSKEGRKQGETKQNKKRIDETKNNWEEKDWNPIIPIITLNLDGLNILIQRRRLSNAIKMQVSDLCYLQGNLI